MFRPPPPLLGFPGPLLRRRSGWVRWGTWAPPPGAAEHGGCGGGGGGVEEEEEEEEGERGEGDWGGERGSGSVGEGEVRKKIP